MRSFLVAALALLAVSAVPASALEYGDHKLALTVGATTD